MLRTELKQLFRLAVPIAAAQAGTQLMTVVDIAVLGRFSARDLAAAGLANAFFFSVSIAGMGVIFGVDPLMSQALGAGDRVRAHRVLWQGVWLGLIVSAALTIPLLLMPMLMPVAGVQKELIEPASAYLVIRTAGLAPFLTFTVVRGYLQARHLTRPLIVSMVVCNIFNVIADIVLVFGAGPIPALGAAGAAVATIIGQLIQLAIVAWAAREPDLVAGTEIRRFNGAEVRQAFSVGWPIALQLGAEIGVFALVGVLAARISTLALAAHQLVIGLASFTYTMSLGVAAAGSTRVGLAVGARLRAATRSAGHAAFIGGAAVMAVAAAVFALAPRPLARVITDKPEVIAAALPLFLVAAYFQLSDGIQAVGSGVLRGAGDTRFAFVANIVGHWLIGMPVALFLGFNKDMGIVGLWWGLCAGLTVVAVLLFLRFERLSAEGIEPI
jgi:multidrug resistance protein, MATE family